MPQLVRAKQASVALSRSLLQCNSHKFVNIVRTVPINNLRNLGTSRSVAAASNSDSPLQTAFKLNDDDEDEVRYRTAKNPVIPEVKAISKRWNTLDAAKQDDIIAYLEDKMRGDWHDITNDEKLALQYIYYGPWGPRDPKTSDPGKIYKGFAGFMALMLGGVVAYRLWPRSEENK